MLDHGRNQISLRDGRRLVFSLAGPGDGVPVVYCHGAMGTALQTSVDLESITDELGIRHVAICRPGIGGSDPAPGRDLLGFAEDVRELVDALSIDRFRIVGVSAGGPYALAISHRLPQRVAAAAICSSLSPLAPPHRTPGMCRRIRLPLAVVAHAPGFCEAMGGLALPFIRRHPGLLSRVIAAHAAPEERRLLDTAGERAAASTSFLTAAGQGVGGMIEDYLVYARPWGFDPREITSEIHLWHGARDPLVPLEHALQLAVTLPRSQLFVAADEGHHFFRRRLRRILAALVGRELDETGEPVPVPVRRSAVKP
jgi:pimeloyl-ACP methyl ester carboxylesterase